MKTPNRPLHPSLKNNVLSGLRIILPGRRHERQEVMNQDGQRLLIAEDNEAIRVVLREHLEAVGFLCQEAKDGLQAFALLKSHPVDILLTDLNMPFMDGIQLIHAVTQDTSCTCPFKFLMSAWITEDVRSRALQAGANGILDKPFSISELVDAIHSPTHHVPQAA